MIPRLARLLAGLLFLPVCAGYSISFYEHLVAVRRVSEPEVWLLLGITAYLAFHVLVGVPSRAYVLGHEITHATAAWVSGGEVKGMKVGAKKGSVAVNRLTAFISLAPYLIPIYAILWAILYAAVGFFVDLKPWVRWFFFGLGATLAFHLVFTVEAVKRKQPDLEIVGPLLSLGIIYLANITLVVGVMSLMSPELRFLAYIGDGARQTAGLYRTIFTQLFL